jgi:cytidylate kinase
MPSSQPGDRVPIEAVVDRQVRAWEERREDEHRPVITISREYGARGAEIGRCVARRADFAYWDQEVVHRIAEDTRMPLAMFVSLDEHRQEEIQELIHECGGVSSDDYLRGLLRVVHTIGEHGRSVIVGRGAHYILGPENALRVRIVRPLEGRIDTIARETGLDRPDVLAHIRTTDADRRAFTRHTFDRDGDAPADYDLTVNSGTLGVEASADLIMNAYRARFSRPDTPTSRAFSTESSRPG